MKTHIYDLSNELIFKISDNLSNRYCISLSYTCKRFNKILKLDIKKRKIKKYGIKFLDTMAKKWLNKYYTNMIYCTDILLEEEIFPNYVKKFIKKHWYSLDNKNLIYDSKPKPMRYFHYNHIQCNECYREIFSLALSVIDGRTLCWDCAH